MSEITLQELTESTVEGNGVFDKFMATINVHLLEQYAEKRITGADYSKVYLGAMQAAFTQAITFTLQKQEAGNQADLILKQIDLVNQQIIGAQKDNELKDKQIEKLTAEISLLAQQEANLVIEGQNLVKQGNQIDANVSLAAKQEEKLGQDILNLQQQVINLQSEKTKTDAETGLVNQNVTNAVSQNNVFIQQALKVGNEKALLEQKKKTEEAQISDTVDTVTVGGILGAQRRLIGTQREGFLRDHEQKVLKTLADTWNIRRSTDPDGTSIANTGMDDPDIQAVANKAKATVLTPPTVT